MSVYIKGMEMPETCIWCPMFNGEWGICQATRKVAARKDCPLVPVPEHGRLIDADAMSEKDNNDFSASIGTAVGFAAKQMMIMAHAQLQQVIENQPTIIPASKEGEG